MEKLGALWIKQGRNGEFLSGKIGDQQIVVFKNNRKKESKHPDFEIFKSEPRQQQAKSAESTF